LFAKRESFLKVKLPVAIESQPTDSACGSTCLQAIYKFWNDEVSVKEIMADIPELETGGTLAVQLGSHALARGYSATIYTYNVQMFDPTWFRSPKGDFVQRLKRQREWKGKTNARLAVATEAYVRFLELGGDLLMQPLERDLIIQHVTSNVPMLAGLSATFLYQESRERQQPPDANGITGVPDDIGGEPVGHFVVLSGYDQKAESVMISDPLHPNPRSPSQHYWARIDHVAAAILLGIVTFDAILLVIRPKS
jgi:hypothetical protein